MNPIGRSEGLAMLWTENIFLEMINYSNHHIHARIREVGSENTQFIIGLYDSPNICSREASWSLLASLNHNTDLWCVFGDFNEIAA